MNVAYTWYWDGECLGTTSREMTPAEMSNGCYGFSSYIFFCQRCGITNIRAVCDIMSHSWVTQKYICDNCLKPDDDYQPYPLCKLHDRLLDVLPLPLLSREFLACMHDPDRYFYCLR